jgi:antirestriction protein ArdC
MRSYAEFVACRLIEQLEAGSAPCLLPQQAGVRFLPVNPISNRRYRGMNALWLLSAACAHGFSDIRWLTSS